MANPTYVLINSYTVTSGGTSSVTFSSIPATYTDLKIVVSSKSSYTGSYYDNMLMTFNGVGSAYSFLRFIGIGGGTSTDGPFTSQSVIYIGEIDASGGSITSNTFSNNEIYISNYTTSNYKSISIDKTLENNSSSNYILGFVAGLWSNSSAISSITFTNASGSFVQYSTIYLYGINNS